MKYASIMFKSCTSLNNVALKKIITQVLELACKEKHSKNKKTIVFEKAILSSPGKYCLEFQNNSKSQMYIHAQSYSQS